MNRKLFSLLTAGVLVLLSSCGDSIVDASYSSPVQTKASLNVVVRNQSTGELLGDVSVKLASTGKEKSTASNGFVSFDDVYVGEHILFIEKEGYATISETVTIGSNDNADYTDVYVAQETTKDIQLYPKTASLSGNLYYPSSSDNNVGLPAAGAQVVLTYTSKFLDRYETATVSADGKFTFENLAAVGTSYDLTALEYKPTASGDNRTFQAYTSFSTPSLSNNAPAYLTNKFQYSTEITSFFLVSHPTTVKSNQAVVFEFSDKIDLTRTEKLINLTNSQVANFAWQDNKVTITPLNNWSSSTFNVSFSNPLYSESGNSLTVYQTTIKVDNSVDLSAQNVQMTAKAVELAGIEVNWTKLSGVTQYTIYYKKSDSDTYQQYMIQNPNATSAVIDINVTKDEVYNIAIRAENGFSQTPLSTATITVTE